MSGILSNIVQAFRAASKAVRSEVIVEVEAGELGMFLPRALNAVIRGEDLSKVDVPPAVLEVAKALIEELGANRNLSPTPVYNWTREAIVQISDLARSTLAQLPNRHFVSIGHSPSYIAYAMDAVIRHGDAEGRITFVPYSDRHLKILPGDRASNVFRPVAEKMLLIDSQVEHYRRFLDDLGLSPRAIIDRFETEGTTTAFMDVAWKAESVMSFMHIMYDWAKSLGVAARFARATECVMFTTFEDLQPPFVIAAKNKWGRTTVGAHIIRIPKEIQNLLSGDYSKDNDRFMPSFGFERWARSPMAVEQEFLGVSEQIKAWLDAAAAGELPRKLKLKTPSSAGQTQKDIMSAARMQGVQELVSAYVAQRERENWAKSTPTAKDPAKKKIKAKHMRPPRIKRGGKAASKDDKQKGVVEPNTVDQALPVDDPTRIDAAQTEGQTVQAVEDVVVDDRDDRDDRTRSKQAWCAARELLYAFSDLGEVLSRRHKDALVRVEGLTSYGEPQSVAAVAYDMRLRPDTVYGLLDDVADFMCRRVTEHAGIDVAPATMAEALRVFTTARRPDMVLTSMWLRYITDDATAKAARTTPQEVKAVRMRMINKMAKIIKSDMADPSPL